MIQSAETRRNLYTHTGKLLPSIKQIVPICFAFSFLIFPNFASAENIPTTNPGCTTTVLGADNVANGSASLEPDFSANTINTTWYSNGTQLTGNNIPATCTYDDTLTPPTPEDRPGYVFGGWRLKVPACEIPSSLVSTNGRSYGYKNDSTGEAGADSYNTSEYGLPEDNTWGVTWANGDKVEGEALCSQTSGTYPNTGTPDETGSGETKYCWCKATHYTANNAQQCSLLSPAWVFDADADSAAGCADGCAADCANLVQHNSGFRVALFGGNVAE